MQYKLLNEEGPLILSLMACSADFEGLSES